MDGEAWIQPPGVIRILHKNRMQMLGRNRALETSLKSWEEKQRQSVAGQGGAKPRVSISGASHDKSRSSATRQSMPGPSSDTAKSFLGVTVDKIRQHSFSGAVSVYTKCHAKKILKSSILILGSSHRKRETFSYVRRTPTRTLGYRYSLRR